MATFEHGHDIRSGDLAARFLNTEAALRAAIEQSSRLEEELRMIELALHCARPAPPAGRIAGGESVVYLNAVPGSGASMTGTLVCSEHITDRPTLPPVEMRGDELVLAAGRIWARLDPAQEATFDIRLEPAYLSYYTELVIPVISGSVSVTLHHSNGGHTYPDIAATTLLRFDTPREFNGRVTLVSKSDTGLSGEYVHALGGLQLKRSTWNSSFEVRGQFEVPSAGTLTVERVTLYPSGEEVSFDIYQGGVKQAAGDLTVAEGEVIEVRAAAVDGRRSCSHLALHYSLI